MAKAAELSTTPIASPSDIAGGYDANAPFWKPGPVEIAALLGWRWAVVAAALASIAALLWMLYHFQIFSFSLSLGMIKLSAFVGAAAISAILWARKRATRLRTDLFCIHCGYSLEGLADGARQGTCPECGRQYDLGVSEEYRRDPDWFISRYRKMTTHKAAALGTTLENPLAKRPQMSNENGVECDSTPPA